MTDLKVIAASVLAALLIVPVLSGEAYAQDQEKPDEPQEEAEKTPPAASTNERTPIVGVSPREELYGPLSDVGFVKSVPLFGSDWRFSFGGYAKLDILTDFAGTGNEFSFVTPTIPVNCSPPPGPTAIFM